MKNLLLAAMFSVLMFAMPANCLAQDSDDSGSSGYNPSNPASTALYIVAFVAFCLEFYGVEREHLEGGDVIRMLDQCEEELPEERHYDLYYPF